MKDSERHLTASERKKKIRDRYRGIDLEEINVIPAAPEEDIYNPSGTKRVAVYARVSTDDPNQTSSYELQKNHYQDYVNQIPNWHLVKIYADEGISGTSLQHREAFKEMIRDCNEGKIDLIITKSVSRFARNTEDCLHYMRQLKALQPPVGIKFETEGIFSLNSDAEMILSFMATLAQEESHNKSEIMNASIAMRFRRGIFLLPELLGYKHDEDGNLIIYEEEARIVKLIFYMFLYGYSCTEIANHLTKLTCQTKRGHIKWSPSTIRGVLQNERHCGDILARKTYTPNYLDHKSKKNDKKVDQYYLPNHHEAIISRADFNAVQKKLQNAKYSTIAFLPSLNVLKEGILKGFVSIHPRWAGFKPEDYYNASRSVYNTDYLEKLYSGDSIEHICEGKEGDFDYRGYEIIRSEFVKQSNHITITIFPKKITFSTEAIRKLPKTDYIELLVHPDRQLLAVRPTNPKNKHALAWRVANKPKITPKAIYGSSFLPSFTELLEWDKGNTYKLIGILKQNNAESFLLFDLRHPEILISKDEENTGNSGSPQIAYPKSWANHFGDSYYLQQNSMKLHEEQEKIWNSQIEGIPYDTEDMKDVTCVPHLKHQIEKITTHLSSQEGQHG